MDKTDIASNAVRTPTENQRFIYFWEQTFHTVLHQGKSVTLAANEADMALVSYKAVVEAHAEPTP